MSASKARGPPYSGAGSPHAGSSSQPLSCNFPDQPRDDVALGFFGCLQLFELLGRQMTLDVLLHQVSSGSRQLLPDGTPQLQANAIKLALMLRWGVGGDMTENGIAAESTADLGRDHERIGLALPDGGV